MPNLLLLDASSSLCSVALLTDQGDFWKTEDQPRRHAQRLLAMVDEILEEAGVSPQALNGVAFGRGPGSFTGIRIAVSVAQGISLGLGIPVCGLSSLQLIARAVCEQDDSVNDVMVIMDAHMGEVFWGQFRRSGDDLMPLSEEQVGTPEVCQQQLSQWQGSIAGGGLQLADFSAYPQALNGIQPEARFMTTAASQAWDRGDFSDPENHPPVYLRNSVAWKKLDEQPSLLKK